MKKILKYLILKFFPNPTSLFTWMAWLSLVIMFFSFIFTESPEWLGIPVCFMGVTMFWAGMASMDPDLKELRKIKKQPVKFRQHRGRTIMKFKIWDNKNKVWMSPVNLFLGHDGKLYQANPLVTGGFKMVTPDEQKEDFIPVYSTGQTDKNGIEIYDGDIWKRETFIAVVTFDYSGWHLLKTESSGCYQYPSFHSNAKTGEIIGNKFEHPQLLESK